jgi:signal transduction histidine kinase
VGWRDLVAASVVESAVVSLQVISAAALVTTGVVAMISSDHDGRWPLALGSAVLLLMLIGPTIAWSLGRSLGQPRPSPVFAFGRLLAAVALVACWTALLGHAAPVGAWAIGVVFGCEVVLTGWALGFVMRALPWWRRAELSSIHLGVVIAVIVALVLAPDRAITIVSVYITFQIVVGSAALLVAGMEVVRRRAEAQRQADRRDLEADAHRQFAHWVHDDVCASLRLVRLRLETGKLHPEAVPGELDALDHTLRLRQLDEVVATGAVQLAEILQPYVRLAQNQGVRIVDVPRFEQASATVSPDAARLVQRALSVLVSNALNADAQELGFRLEPVQGASVLVEIEDDAGGFDLDRIPVGRGLDRLRGELGGESVSCVRTRHGSRVSVVVPIGAEA